MGSNRYKIEYTCECGQDYGSCGRKNSYLLECHRGTDTFQLYQKTHVGDPTEKIEHILSGTDEDLSALTKLLNQPEESDWTIEDFNDVKKERGW